MTAEEFKEKWNVAFLSREEQKEFDVEMQKDLEAYYKEKVKEYDSFLLQLLASYHLPEIEEFIVNQELKQ